MTDTANTKLPIAPRSTPWDKNSEIPKLRDFAKATDAPNAEYATYFFFTENDGKNFGDYHLPFVGIIDGAPHIIPRAVFGDAAAIQGARSGAKLPDAARTEAKDSIEKVYVRMAKLFDDTSIEAPWLSKDDSDEIKTETKSAAPAETRAEETVETAPVETLYRTFEIESYERGANPDERTLSLSFSSETPVQRSYGLEVLSHDPADVDLSRLNAAGPVLYNHKQDHQIGVVQKAWVDSTSKKGRALVKFSKNPQASEIWNDIQDGIVRNVSVGYVTGKPSVKGSTYTFPWQASHIAIVSEPADVTVGINRGLETNPIALTETNINRTEDQTKGVLNSMNDTTTNLNTSADAIKSERSRVNEIRAIAKQFSTVSELQTYADRAVADGTDLSVFQTQAFKMLESKNAVQTVTAKDADIGLTHKEAQQFSLGRMIRHLSEPGNKRLADEAGFEIESTRAAEKAYGATRRSETSFIMPYEAQRVSHNRLQRNINLTSGADAIETQVEVGSWIDYLYNATQVISAGAQVLGGLTNSIQIPVTSASNAITWLATDGTSTGTETDITVSKVNLSPHNAMGYTAFTRAALAQVPGLDAVLEKNLAESMAVGLDAAYLNGSGASGQPTGIANTSGVGSVAFGTNGGAPTYGLIMQMVQKLAVANALTVPGHKAFLIEAFGQETLATTLKTSTDTTSNFILGGMTNDLTKMCGYDVLLSNQVLSNLTKGTETNCSQIFFGNFAEILIGMFYTEFLVNPYLLSTSNQIALFAYQGTDIALKHPASFCTVSDMITGNSV